MPQDRKIDPITKDYVDDGLGATEWTSSSQTMVHHQVLDYFDEWPGDPATGSRLHKLSKKLTERVMHEATDAVNDALRPLVELGAIGSPDVEVSKDQHGRLALSAAAEDIQGGGEVDVSPLLPWSA